MPFFDAHCDAVMHIEDDDFDFVAGKGRSHMDLPRLLAAGHRARSSRSSPQPATYPGRDLRAYAERAIPPSTAGPTRRAGRCALRARVTRCNECRVNLLSFPCP